MQSVARWKQSKMVCICLDLLDWLKNQDLGNTWLIRGHLFCVENFLFLEIKNLNERKSYQNTFHFVA